MDSQTETGPPARRQAATHYKSERRKGLLYSRKEEVEMASVESQMWGVCAWTWKDRHRPEARELQASGGRGSSSWDLYEEDLL